MTQRFSRLALRSTLALGLAGLLVSGCDEEKKVEKSPRSQVAVELPSKPALTPPQYTKTHADGVWTVEGLLRNNKEAMGKTVKVRGKIVELRQCPPPEPYTEAELARHAELHEKWVKQVKWVKATRSKKIPAAEPILKPKKQDRTCNPRPLAMLQDEPPNARFKLLVAGSMYSPLKNFKDGQTVTVEGTFDMVSPDGHYMQQDGLIHLKDLPEPEDEGKIQEAPGEPAGDATKKKK